MFFTVEKIQKQIETTLNNPSDLSFRLCFIGQQRVLLAFLKSMTNETSFIEGVYKPLKESNKFINTNNLINEILNTYKVERINKKSVFDKILHGNVVIFVEDEQSFICADIEDFPMRVPTEPPTSPVISGPREGFTEDINTNITLIRRRFYTNKLVLKNYLIGKYSNTKVCLVYLEGIASREVVKKVKKKLEKIKIDGIIDSFYISEFLKDRPNSMFKQIGTAEKPDIIASKILEGRVAILVDGSPMALTVPFMLFEDLQNSNDYYTNNHYVSYIRFIRLLGLLLSVLVPAIYLALRLFHFNVIPTKFLITISDTTRAIPFTPFVELLFITFLFQILYEVSLRLPSYLGLATSIVGALILGETGVSAGLISPPGVIVIALSKIAVYTLPEQAPQITLLHIIFLILGGCLGLLGIVGGMFYLINYLNDFDSYGAPYLAPYSPRVESDLKDGIFKKPLIFMKKRPESYKVEKRERQE